MPEREMYNTKCLYLKNKKPQINGLSSHIKKLAKEGQTQANRRKEIINIEQESMKMKTSIIEKVNKTKVVSLKD